MKTKVNPRKRIDWIKALFSEMGATTYDLPGKEQMVPSKTAKVGELVLLGPDRVWLAILRFTTTKSGRPCFSVRGGGVLNGSEAASALESGGVRMVRVNGRSVVIPGYMLDMEKLAKMDAERR